MTLTREQVIAAFAAEFEPMGYSMELAKCQCCTFASESTQGAFMGFAAGRDQGLREAKEVIATFSHWIGPTAKQEINAAIEQLRGK